MGKSAAGKEAVDDLTANPVSEINRDGLKAALAKSLAKEPDFVQELTELLKQAGKRFTTASTRKRINAGKWSHDENECRSGQKDPKGNINM